MKEYQDMLEALEKLRNLVNSYYTYDEYGEQPKLFEEDIAELSKAYDDVFKLTLRYLESVSEEKALSEKANMEKVDLIQEQLQKDISALQHMEPGMTLPSVMKYANNRIIDVTGKTFKKMGENSSTRQLMTITGPDGRPLKGLFTERYYAGINRANIPYYVKRIQRLNPQLVPFTDLIVYRLNEHLDYTNDPIKGYSKEEKNKLKERFGDNEEIRSAIEMIDGAILWIKGPIANAKSFLNEENSLSPFDTRNIAMSNVAHLLGIDDKIAKSTPMIIKDKGQEIQGCFMEFIEGEDPNNPKKDGKILDIVPTAFDNSPVLKTASDIQVLDYICGNRDRHGFNMIYKFDDNGKVIDITGIDNDMSFGHLGKEIPNVDVIFHMSKSMHERVMNLDEHQLLRSLDGLGFEQKNKDMAIERLNALKEKINEGKVIIIDDKDYENFKRSDFMKGSTKDEQILTYKGKSIEKSPGISIYFQMYRVIENMKDNKQRLLEEIAKKEKEPKEINDSYTKLEWDEISNIKVEDLEIGKDVPQVSEFKDKLRRAGRFIFNSSPQFENVKTALEKISEINNYIAKDETKLTEKNVKALEVGYKKLLQACNEYIMHKKDQGKLDAWSWTPTGKRIKAVRELAIFAKGRIESLEIAIENTMDKEAVDKKEIREMKNEAQKLMFEGMEPKQVGKYMKNLLDMHDKNLQNKDMTVKLGHQMSMCIDYIKDKGVNLDKYDLSVENLTASKQLIKEARLCNAELKKNQPNEIKDERSKAAVMTVM